MAPGIGFGVGTLVGHDLAVDDVDSRKPVAPARDTGSGHEEDDVEPLSELATEPLDDPAVEEDPSRKRIRQNEPDGAAVHLVNLAARRIRFWPPARRRPGDGDRAPPAECRTRASLLRRTP